MHYVSYINVQKQYILNAITNKCSKNIFKTKPGPASTMVNVCFVKFFVQEDRELIN